MNFNDAIKLFEAGRYEMALDIFQDLREDNPHDADLHYNIACCLTMLDRQDEAREALHRAIALNPQYRYDAQADPDMAALLHAPSTASGAERTASPPSATSTATAPAATSMTESPTSSTDAGLMDCPTCGTENRINNWKCVQCGAQLHPAREARVPPMSSYRNYLPASIALAVVGLLFCSPFGLIAIVPIVYASKAQAAHRVRDYVEASRTSRLARRWFYSSLGVMLIPLLAIATLLLLDALNLI